MNSDSIEISFYFCSLAFSVANEQVLAQFKTWLPEDEKAKAGRYLYRDAQVQGMLVRGYLRGILSLFAKKHGVNIAPDEWLFDYLEKGKPILAKACFSHCPIVFNLSHSGNMLLIAVALGKPSLQLGVDIERRRQSTQIQGIWKHYFIQSEIDDLQGISESQQRDRFFDLWALKESFIKAKGLGLALSLRSFGFDFKELDTQDFVINSLFVEEGENRFNASLSRGIGLILDNKINRESPASWQLLLGHLNPDDFKEDYRFALSIDHTQPILPKAFHCQAEQMLKQLSFT